MNENLFIVKIIVLNSTT